MELFGAKLSAYQTIELHSICSHTNGSNCVIGCAMVNFGSHQLYLHLIHASGSRGNYSVTVEMQVAQQMSDF